jgi:CRP-like cAMP-binding protein
MARGESLPLLLHSHHAWFGEEALLSGQPGQVDYVCITQVELICMPQSCLEDALREEPQFRQFMFQQLARRVEQHTELQLLLRLGGMPLRVVMGLARFAVNQPYSFAAHWKQQPEDAVDISLSQDQIAAVCGVSRTLLSECLQQLARGGWVKLRYGGMSLQKAAAWRVFAQKWQLRQSRVGRQSMDELLDELARAGVEALSLATRP